MIPLTDLFIEFVLILFSIVGLVGAVVLLSDVMTRRFECDDEDDSAD